MNKKLKRTVGIVAVVLVAGLLVTSTALSQSEETVQVNNPVREPASAVNTSTIAETITLDVDNTLNIRVPFDDGLLTETFKGVTKAALVTKKPLYVVIRSPGGSVETGQNLIQSLQGLKRPVHTVTLFAASMGFQTVQNLGTRYITPTGTLMSHRMSGGVGGEFGGNLESRYKHASRMGDNLDIIAAKRMGITLEAYKAMVGPEYWVDGKDAIDAKAADKIAHIVCTQRLLDSNESVKLQTLFGAVTINFSGCPLINNPVSVLFGDQVPPAVKAQVEANVRKMFGSQEQMLNNYVRQNRSIDLTSSAF